MLSPRQSGHAPWPPSPGEFLGQEQSTRFNEVLEEQGYLARDFEIGVVDDVQVDRTGRPFNRLALAVRRRPSDITRRYPWEGRSPRWLNTFFDDLKDGLFGPPSLEVRIVAFLDLLGFRALVDRMLSDEPELFQFLLGTFRRLSKDDFFGTILDRDFVVPYRGDVALSSFSDSIVVSIPATVPVLALYERVAYLARNLLISGISLRGGIAVGPTYHHKNVVIGRGLIEAYALESSVAKFPRIVVAPELEEPASEWLRRDLDGVVFLDVLFFKCPHSRQDSSTTEFQRIGRSIAENLGNAQKNPDHLRKWEWLAQQYNTAFGRIEPPEVRRRFKPVEPPNEMPLRLSGAAMPPNATQAAGFRKRGTRMWSGQLLPWLAAAAAALVSSWSIWRASAGARRRRRPGPASGSGAR